MYIYLCVCEYVYMYIYTYIYIYIYIFIQKCMYDPFSSRSRSCAQYPDMCACVYI